MEGDAAAQLGGERLFAAALGAIDQFLRGGLLLRIVGVSAAENVAEQLAIGGGKRRLECDRSLQARAGERIAALKLGGARDPELLGGLRAGIMAGLDLLERR